MLAQRYIARVRPDGTLDLPELGYDPGTEVEVIVLSNGTASADGNPAELSFALSVETLRRLWDDPEEDAAWRDLQQVM